MEPDKHPLNLGKLLVNFQSLEFILRAFLYEKDKRGKPKPLAKDKFTLDAIKKGDILEDNAFTNYDNS